ncbi:uncharacterized protein LOC144447265 isoform X2 [Glandiceps talaboti]
MMNLERESIRALTNEPGSKDSNLVHSNGRYCNQFMDMIGSMEDLRVDDSDRRMAFQGASPLQIPFPTFNGPPQSMPYSVNLDMAMNNDILDLSKPLRGYPLRKGVSNISLDSLNDNYIEPNSDAFRCCSRGNSSTEGSLENLLELRESIQDCNETEDFSDFERWNNFVNLAKSQNSTTSYEQDRMQIVKDENTNLVNLNDEESETATAKDALSTKGPLPLNPNFHLPLKSRSVSAQIHNQLYGPVIHSAPAMENASTASNSTMSFATTNSLKSDMTASPESYDMLYKSFEIAAMIDQEERKHGRTLTASVPNIEMLSPKLQRLRQITREVTSSSSPQPNFCSFAENFRRNEEIEKPESESKKVTFADLAKQRKQLEQEDVRPQSLPVSCGQTQHWTELLSSTKTPDFMKQNQPPDTLSPRRPQSLPIGLRHVTKPSSRPFPKEFTPDSFGSTNFEPPPLYTPDLGVSRTYSAPEGFARGDKEKLVEEKCYDSVDNLDCIKDVSDDVKRRRRSEELHQRADESNKSPLVRPRSASAGRRNSKTGHYLSNTNTPVKVRQSLRNKVLEQDLLGEVVYVQNKPLKPIYMVDAEYNRRKGLPPPPGPPPAPLSISQPILPATNTLPPNVDFMDQPSFFGCDDAPVNIPLSAYEEMESYVEVNISQKKGLVSGMNSAVDLILEHFGKSRQASEKVKLGDSYYTPDIGHMVLRYLCPAITTVLSDGLQPHIRNVIVGRVKNTLWNVVQATTKLGPGTRQLHEIVSHICQQSYLSEPMMKFNCFVFGLLNTNCLELWLQHVRSRIDTLETLYEPEAFLRLASTGLKSLFEDLLVAVQPLAELPFRLDYKFEYNYIEEMRAREQGKQRLMEEHEKKSFFSPFQLMKKVTRKTYERVTTKSQSRCAPNDSLSSMDDNHGGGSGKGWTVNWMRGLVSAGNTQDVKVPSTKETPPRVTDRNATRSKSDQFRGLSKSQNWSLFGSSFSKALEGLIPDTGSLSTHSLLTDPLHPFKAYRKCVGSEKTIPAYFAEELMGPRPDPAGASDSTASSPVWNFKCHQTIKNDIMDDSQSKMFA